MDGDEMVRFLASLAAIAGLLALGHFLGFTRGATLDGEDGARELLRLAPGGFEPAQIALDAQGKGAVARDRAGRIAVILAHGGQFAVRTLSPDARLTATEGLLRIQALELGGRAVELQLGAAARDWAGAAAPAN